MADLEDLVTYIAASNVDAALSTEDRIVAAAARLDAYPMRGRRGRWGETRELAVARTPYLIIYRASAAVEILRVMHGARSWPPEDQP